MPNLDGPTTTLTPGPSTDQGPAAKGKQKPVDHRASRGGQDGMSRNRQPKNSLTPGPDFDQGPPTKPTRLPV